MQKCYPKICNSKIKIMKNLLLITLLTLFLKNLNSQNEYFNSNQVWHLESSCHYSSDCLTKQLFVFYANGDTTIGTHVYKKIYNKSTFSYSNYPGSTCYSPMYGPQPNNPLLMRSLGKKIYTYIPLSFPFDTLMYDFDLTLGDTVPVSYNNPNYSSSSKKIVISIDSFFTSIGYLKKFHLNNGSKLIEGAGFDFGFFANFISNYWECGNSLKCFSVNDTSYYPTVGGMACIKNVGINEKALLESNLKVYPNPANSVLNVEFLNGHFDGWPVSNVELLSVQTIAIIQITDTFGQTVLTEKINSQHTKININHLKDGLYYLSFKSKDKMVTQKLIIQK